MKKTMRYVVVLLLLTELSLLLAPGLTAQALQTGVYPGNYFVYGKSDGSPWVEMVPSNAPLLGNWEKFLNLSTMRFDVIPNQRGASDTTISFNQTIGFRNGTDWNGRGVVDVINGVGTGILFFIPAGLGAGDQIYPMNLNFTWTINSTQIDRTHWEGREICVLNTTTVQPPANGTYMVRRSILYWDQLTGVLLSSFEEAAAYNTQSQVYLEGRLLYQLLSTNRFSTSFPQPLDMTPIYIAVAGGLTLALIFVVVRTITGGPKKKYKRLEKD
jgi:hypothetical protein